MSTDPTPSTGWTERPADDELERFARYAQRLGEVQKARNERYGAGRVLHRKQLLGLAGTLEVLPDLPEPAAQGLFARTGAHEVLVRLSNGGVDRARDSTPDIRGFALKVRGVEGPGALGFDTKSQDFLLINQPTFGIGSADEFVGLVVNAAAGRLQLVRYALGRYGVRGGLSMLKATQMGLSRPFSGFATETFYSAAPLACGPYAARVRLVPVEPSAPNPGAQEDWSADVTSRLADGALRFDLQLQFFVDENTTPIENASVDWPTPYLTVARLTIPSQDPTSAEGAALQDAVESAAFDPWSALVEHRPLGEIMRARKAAYRTSQLGRGAS